MIALALLALVFTASSTGMSKYEKDVETYDEEENELSPATEALYLGLTDLVEKFECDRNDKDCEIWRLGSLEAHLNVATNNCDKANSALCKEARKLLGDKENKMTHQQIKDAIAEKAKVVFDDVDSKRTQVELNKHLKKIWKATTDYVCYKIPSECKAAR
jgi:hypothetical protein